jgi:hypothetical protein
MDHTNTATVRRVSRWAGLVGLVFLVLAFMSQNPPFYRDASNTEMLHWVQAHPTALYVEGVRTAFMMVLMVGFLGTLMWRAGLRDPLRSFVWALLGASMAIDMVWSGVYYALAFTGQHGVGDPGVLALASLTEQMTFTDGFLWGIAVLVISVAALRTRSLPAALAWLGVLTAVFKVIEPAAQVVLNHTSEGVTGPLGTVLLVFWVLATSLTLVIRPSRAVRVLGAETLLRESPDPAR